MLPATTLAAMTLLSPGQNPDAAGAPPAGLVTVAESSGYTRTGRYDEVERLCPAFAAAYPGRVRCLTFGTTPEGRPMLALIASSDGVLEAEEARRRGRPVVLFQGGIHSGEIDGKDAGFLVLREALEGRMAAGSLAKVVAVFVPVFNVDGHERFGPHNRPNQVGPEEMGFRTTAQNLNLNRDYAKADAPEMQAMLGLLAEWDPLVYVDLHVTNGAELQPEIGILVQPTLAGPPALAEAGRALQDGIVAHLSATKHLALPYYPSFVREDEPTSGFAVGVFSPRFSHGYWDARDRLGLLVETHSWKDYRTRVGATVETLVALLDLTAREGARWRKAVEAADDAARRIGGTEVVLAYESDKQASGTIEFPGYAYEREPSAVSGGLRIRYDTTRPQTWSVPFFGGIRPTLTVRAPAGGYVVPAAHAPWMAEKLRLHGLESRRLEQPIPAAGVEAFRATEVTFAKEPFEGRFTATVKGAWAKETRAVPAGSLFVPIAQPGARLLLHLLEPTSPDSFLAWGFFHAVFERKEYMDSWVAEDVAAAMLAEDPGLREEFARRLAEDEAFAKDPRQRLDFFYRRHPSWDERLNLYPVLRVERAP